MNKGLRRELATVCGLGSAALFLFGRRRLSAALGVAAFGLATAKDRPESFRGRTAIITGGSRGLGLALAARLLDEGANVSLLARDATELERARELLRDRYPEGTIVLRTCDVTKDGDFATALQSTIDELGPIDLLINNAGAMTVAPFEATQRADYEAQMNLHVYAVLDAVKLVLPRFLESGGGRIVNVCSLGGKTAVPHMLPYDTSKFALAGLSQGLAAELGRHGITVTTVYPSVMRTGSPIQAVFKGDAEREFEWFATLDVMPVLSMAADVAARKIIEASRERRTEVILSGAGKLRVAAGVFFPELMAKSMELVTRLMPSGTSSVARTGAESRGLFDKSLWAAPLRRRQVEAEKKWNQAPKNDAEFAMGLKPTRIAFDP